MPVHHRFLRNRPMKARSQKDKRHPTQNRVPHFVMQSIPAIICFISTSNFKHPIRNKILTSAVALNDCFDQIFRYIGIICEKLFSVLGQAVPAGRCQILDNFAFLKFNPCCSVYPRTAARQIRSYGSSAENPSALAIGAQYLNVSPIIETLVFALEEAAAVTGRNFLPTRHSPQKIRCSGAFLQLHRSWQESHSGCHLRNPLLLGIRKALPI